MSDGVTPSEAVSPPTPVLSVHVADKIALYNAYMPFIKNCGIFIPTNESFEMGQTVTLHLRLMEEKERFEAHAKVIWITPKGAQGGRSTGIGFQLTDVEQAKIVRNKIETFLGGALSADRRTETM